MWYVGYGAVHTHETTNDDHSYTCMTHAIRTHETTSIVTLDLMTHDMAYVYLERHLLDAAEQLNALQHIAQLSHALLKTSSTFLSTSLSSLYSLHNQFVADLSSKNATTRIEKYSSGQTAKPLGII